MVYVLIITTTNSKEEAEMISQTLVGKGLAGCVQILGPITSTYWWKGKFEKAEEWLCIIKSRKDLFKELESVIRAVHSYEVPEIVAIPVVKGSKNYLDWLKSHMKKRSLDIKTCRDF